MQTKQSKGMIILRQYLNESKETHSPILATILKVLTVLPFNIDALKASKIGKIVKNCMSDESGFFEVPLFWTFYTIFMKYKWLIFHIFSI